MSRLILGTAQLDMPYGIANRSGKPDLKEALAMVCAAWEGGIRTFDTAESYGESESMLGFCFKELGIAKEVRVFSKVHSKSFSTPEKVEASVKKLGIEKLHGLLLQGGWRVEWEPLLKKLKEEGLIAYAGISIYDWTAFEQALRVEGIDTIQVPFNIFDQRALRENWFEKAGEQNKKIIIRSVYLQGLLTLEAETLPPHMQCAKKHLLEYSSYCKEVELSQKEVALAFALNHSKDSFVIIGAETATQISENIAAYKKWSDSAILKKVSFSPGVLPDKLINPFLWEKDKNNYG